LYYISGPNAFPEVPFELSEVIDILELHKREVDLSSVAARLSKNLHRRIKSLENKIDSVSSTKVHEKDLENLELRYSDILNQYYDYTFWLSDDMPGIEDEIQELSSRIESLKSAQGI
jgi:predicted  nucleic acid-binding Zn-ribbon protein